MTNLQSSAQKQLRQMVEQIQRLEEEKGALAEDIRDKYAEAKGVGFDVKALRRIIRELKKSKAERDEADAIYETYAAALGMIGTPLGEYADRQDDREREIERSNGTGL